jgi:hypothetical protein
VADLAPYLVLIAAAAMAFLAMRRGMDRRRRSTLVTAVGPGACGMGLLLGRDGHVVPGVLLQLGGVLAATAGIWVSYFRDRQRIWERKRVR